MNKSAVKAAPGAVCAVLACLLVLALILNVSRPAGSKSASGLFGISFLVVLSDSMYPALEGGDLILIREFKDEMPEEGDIISFYDRSSGEPAVITHRIVGTEMSRDGSISYMTKGDGNNSPDMEPVKHEDVIGKLFLRLPGVGRLIWTVREYLPWICAAAAVIYFLLAVAAKPHEDNKYEDA